jgi:prefoldin beta subunit
MRYFMATQQNEGEAQEAEKMVREYQMVQEQLRGSSMQLEQLHAQKAELEKAQEELTGATGKVYITVGGVIVETTKQKAIDDIKGRTEVNGVRITALTKQLTELKAKDKQLSEKLTLMYKQGQGNG